MEERHTYVVKLFRLNAGIDSDQSKYFPTQSSDQNIVVMMVHKIQENQGVDSETSLSELNLHQTKKTIGPTNV